MTRYYCDYCDTYLTHDSPSVRKQHNAGYKHKANVRTYYQQFEEQQTQSIIDERIKMHLGQAAAMQVGASFNQHLMSLPGNMQRPRLPILPTPFLPIGMPQATMNAQFLRPPLLPVPVGGAPGYPGAPGAPGVPTVTSGATSMPLPMAPLPRPPTLPPPTSGTPGLVAPNSSAPFANPAMYQTNPPPSSVGTNYDIFGASSTSAPQGGNSSGAPATTTS